MIHCLSPNGATLAIDERLPERLLVATLEGVVAADRGADGFREVSRALTDRHIASLWYDRESAVVLAGSYDGGVFVSRDAGTSFELASELLASAKVYTVAIQPRATGARWYVGTEPVGLFCSDDEGASWRELPGITTMPGREHWTFPGPPHLAHLKNLTFVPGQDERLYAAVEQGGLFSSSDGGASFSEIESIVQLDDDWYRDVHRFALRPGSPDVAWLTGGDGVSMTTDAGASWRRVLPTSSPIGYPDGLVVHPDRPDVVLVSGASAQPGTWRTSHCADAHVARSTDGGASFTVVGAGLPSPLVHNIEAMSLGVAGEAHEVVLGTTGGEVFMSRDLGDTFVAVLEGLPPISKGGHFRALVASA